MKLTVADVAKSFGVSVGTVARWVQEGNLPASEVDSQYRFNRDELLEWATLHKLAIPTSILRGGDEAAGLSLADALAFGGVAYGMSAGDHDELLRAALQGLPLADADVDRQTLIDLFLARERLGTTAIGDGVAIPHPRYPLVLALLRPAVRLCFLDSPWDLDAPDGKPIDTLFLMACPTVHVHLRLLARLASALCSDPFRQLLIRRAPAAEIIAALRHAEAAR